MAPNEDPNEEEQEDLEEEESIEEKTEEKVIDEPSEETSDEVSEEFDDELDTEKELDRLRFKYRGFTLEELKKMNADEFIQILPARARRSLKRGLPPRQKKLLGRLRRAYRAK